MLAPSGPAEPPQYRTASTSSRRVDDAFGEQEALCQFDIRTRRAHGYGDRAAVDPDFHWFLDSQRFGPGESRLGREMLRSAARCHPTHAALTAVTWRRDKMTSSQAPVSSRATVNASG